MTLRSPEYSLRIFSESVAALDVLEIMDAVLAELHAIKMQFRTLGFGNMPRKGSRPRRYFDDLTVLVPLYTSTAPPQFRVGYVEEAWPMLRVLSQRLVSLSDLRESDCRPKHSRS
jgi:hypothetical protein